MNRTGLTIGVALAAAAGFHLATQAVESAQREKIGKQAAIAALRTNPVGEAFVRMMMRSGKVNLAPDRLHATAIFDPATSPKDVERKMNRLRGPGGLLGYELNDRWGGPTADTAPLTLTYSFPPDGTNIGNFATLANGAPVEGSWVESGETTSSMFSRWDTAFGGTNGANWKPFFRQAFDRWEELTGNRYVEVSDDGAPWPGSDGPFHGGSGRGDIRITSALDDGGGGSLAFNFFPDTADMLLDSADLVSTRYLSSANNYRYLRNVIMHEHGHGMGLGHVCPRANTKLMEPFVATQFDGPQLDDVIGAQRAYGDTYEPNDSLATSSPPSQTGWDAEMTGSQSLQHVSIASDVDEDYFRVVTEVGAYALSVTASPTASLYSTGPQTQLCNTGELFDSGVGVDLQIDVLNSLGVVMQTRNDHPVGEPESINGLQLATPGVYHVRVKRASGTPFTDIQPYSVSIALQTLGASADLTANGCVDGFDLAVLLAQWGVNPGAPSDFNVDGVVDGMDLAFFLSFWSPCP